jgi:hypothetical protein
MEQRLNLSENDYRSSGKISRLMGRQAHGAGLNAAAMPSDLMDPKKGTVSHIVGYYSVFLLTVARLPPRVSSGSVPAREVLHAYTDPRTESDVGVF